MLLVSRIAGLVGFRFEISQINLPFIKNGGDTSPMQQRSALFGRRKAMLHKRNGQWDADSRTMLRLCCCFATVRKKVL